MADAMTDVSQNPFQPCREQLQEQYLQCLRHLDDVPHILFDDKLLIRAVLTYTPNQKLLQRFSSLTIEEVADLCEVSYWGLKNLRCSDSTDSTVLGHGYRFNPQTKEPLPVEAVLPGGKLIFAPPLPPLGVSTLPALSIHTPLPQPEGILDQPRSTSIDALALERQQGRCAVLNLDFFQRDRPWDTAHLFPYSALSNEDSETTWAFLAVFLGERLYEHLSTTLSSCLHTCGNEITLEEFFCRKFDMGWFSLQPLSLVPGTDGHFLDVKLHMEVPLHLLYEYSWQIDDPKYQCALTTSGKCYITEEGQVERRCLRNDAIRYLIPDEVIRLSTPDPEQLPLPSTMLLWWRLSIWRLLGAAGLRETTSLSDIDSKISTTKSPCLRLALTEVEMLIRKATKVTGMTMTTLTIHRDPASAW
ncbi:hypothetical protein Dda_7330 [Drechslerella dactyloides]|uniref:HNH nuclease domain-containing protein n=1 Tax=Drechslerella dactyloides TaxID=74499 RepID=A0AAD6NGL8_DREDA|nr:hypothetical protein Dda_7330 [Drechslerella dactyloides]